MPALKRIFVIILLLLLVSCSKPVPPEKATYVGQWKAPNMMLLITQESLVSYKRTESKIVDGGKSTVSFSKSLFGYIKTFHGDNFEVGISFATTIFVVTETPHQVDGKWKMTVDGVELTKEE